MYQPILAIVYIYSMKLILSLFAFIIFFQCDGQTFVDPHGLEKRDSSPSYNAVASFYKNLSKGNKNIRVKAIGPTDTDEPLLVVYYSADGELDINKWKEDRKVVVLINNGIHPGEPDGIVATMELLWDVTKGKVSLPDNVVLAIIPVFNVSGGSRLRANSRANQNGPMVTGFRGNAQNLDLNRDFTKMDAKETRTLVRLFRLIDPDILIDNHVSNGADYQHVMTLLSTQHNKLGGPMGKYLNKEFEPALYTDMKKRGYDLVPYVNVWGKSPDSGWQTYIEGPRYLSGYAAMFNTYAFVAETHMLKPYADRIDATYKLMQSVIDYAGKNNIDIKRTRDKQLEWIIEAKQLPISWTVDTTTSKMIELKGYEAGTKPSLVSGEQRLFYDRTKPFTKEVPFYGNTVVTDSVEVPYAYVIPRGWHRVIQRLKHNGVIVDELNADTTMELTVYHIADYNTTPNPYEGHYLHSDINVNSATRKLKLQKGDHLIVLDQPAKRYIVEVLEPTAPDGFFAWGFFDGMLQQKEYFSAYVFEDLAADMLESDTTLRQQFVEYKTAHPELANNSRALLHYIYQHSPYYEPEHLRYPVFRLE